MITAVQLTLGFVFLLSLSVNQAREISYEITQFPSCSKDMSTNNNYKFILHKTKCNFVYTHNVINLWRHFSISTLLYPYNKIDKTILYTLILCVVVTGRIDASLIVFSSTMSLCCV
jgi:hypothetical protein